VSSPQASSDSDVLARKPRRPPLFRLAAILAVLGLVLSVGGAWKVRQLERKQLTERFSRIVQTDLSFIGTVIQRHESALFALRVQFGTSGRVTREEFRLAVEDLRKHSPTFSLFEWVPVVSEAERDAFEAAVQREGFDQFALFDKADDGRTVPAAPRPEHWPVLYAEPLGGNEMVLGYDLAAGPTVADIGIARDSGETRLTRPRPLLQEKAGRRSVIAILPVYAPRMPQETVAQRRAAFRGVVEGISEVGEVFKEVYEERAEVAYDFTVILPGEEAVGPELMFYRSARATDGANAGPPTLTPAEGEFAINRLTPVGQRTWLFHFAATPEWIRKNTPRTPLLTLLIGLLATVVTSGILVVAGRQTQSVEAKVRRRTLELRAANERLEQEARERSVVERSLRDSEQSLVEAQRIARLGRWESVPATGRLLWSAETFRIFGVSPEVFQPSIEAFYALVHPDDRAHLREQVQAALQLGIPYRLIHRSVLADGSVRHLQENAELVRDPADGSARLIGTVLDVTERQLAENALASERNLLRTLLDAIPDPIVVKDREARYVLLNLANARALRVPDRAQAVGKTDAEYWPAEQAELQAADDRAVMASGRAVINREEFISNQAPGWYLTNKIPLRDERGSITGLISISRDITDRRRMLEELEREHALLRTLIDTLPDFVYVKDRAGRYVLTNTANLGLLGGRPMEEVIGKTIHDLFPAEHARLYEEDDRRVLDHGEFIINREHPMRFPGGRDGWVLTTKVPIRERDGRISAVFGVSRDITENKRLQLERAEMDRRINQSQKLESLGALAGGVAHDFNNILTIILNNATLAKGQAADPALFDECLGQIEHAAARAAHLCNQMLAYSGRGQFVIQPIRLADLVEDTLPLLRSGVTRKAQLDVMAEPCEAVAQADVTQIRQIVLNLVINASDALGDTPGTIRITTGLMHAGTDYLRETILATDLVPGDFVFLEVADTGCGMSPETVAKIFEPFFTTKFAGRGLGLAAVLGIVRGHRGAIRVDSQPGRGTTFRLLLPAVHGVAPRALGRPSEPLVSARVTGKILVVDDEEFIRSVLCRSLGKVGFETVAAASGREAISLLATNRNSIAAVLLDLTMPQMDGQQTFEELRKLHPTLPVLLMSGFSELEATARFAGQGLAGFIQKPFETVALVEQLRLVIQGRAK
jgi:PAS domain S-box-containing protein